MRKVFIEDLEKEDFSDNRIAWRKSINKKVHFIYDEVNDYFEIISYDGKKQILTISYNNNVYDLKTNSLRFGQIGQLTGKINYAYIYNVGDTIEDNNRNLTILDTFIDKRKKYYKYKCNICGWSEGIINEYHLKAGIKCSCCTNRTAVKGINDITTTDEWMVKFFQNGYSEASKYTKCSGKYIYPKCPECKTISNKKVPISSINKGRGFSCPVCKDGYSYPEKFVYSILKQLKIDFIMQFSSRDESWVENFRYDFYIKTLKCIIEVNGIQHYQNMPKNWGVTRSFEKEIHNDLHKKELALLHNVTYYEIDCRYSTISWIKTSILKSGLLELLNATENDIDWNKCHEFATSNLCKTICDIKKNNPEFTASDIAKLTLMSKTTICNYLKIGHKLGWCYYNGNNKRIMVLKDGKEIGIFSSVKEVIKDKQFENFTRISIQKVCRGKNETYKGYKFIYV